MSRFFQRLMRRMEIRATSPLDKLIPGEIRDDAFHSAIVRYASEGGISSILEIGSSTGEGSTRAFVEGILKNPAHPKLYCMEVSEARFAALQDTYAMHTFVRPFNYSSVPISAFPTHGEVEHFYNTHQTNLNRWPLTTVLDWLQADIDYVMSHGKDVDGIQLIKQTEQLDAFDLVLIDGSEFTGRMELKAVLGSRVILLDDINTYKNFENYHDLAQNPEYRLEEDNWSLRNGYAIFKKSPSKGT